MDTITTDQQDVENIQDDLSDYVANGDISEGDARELLELNRRSKQATQVPSNPSEFVH